MNEAVLLSNPKVIPVILSGGSGSRLWPLSRGSYPKQFWRLLGEHTLLQDTVLRSSGIGLSAPVIVCNAEHRFIIAEQLREVGVTDATIVLEPEGRNSAPAVAAAAFLVAEQDPDAILWIMTADAAIGDVPALSRALDKAVAAAAEGYVVTFGMRPTRAETGYGYIEQGAELPGVPGAWTVSRFVEKPSAEVAATLVADSRYLWNSGMFIARARTFLEETRAHAPQVFDAVQQAVSRRVADLDFERLDPASFCAAPDISVDYAIAERTALAATVPGDFGWSDIGSWDACGNSAPRMKTAMPCMAMSFWMTPATVMSALKVF